MALCVVCCKNEYAADDEHNNYYYDGQDIFDELAKFLHDS